jgi:hypothetical protein
MPTGKGGSTTFLLTRIPVACGRIVLGGMRLAARSGAVVAP